MCSKTIVHHNEDGFTLLETMVAIALFSIVALGIAYNSITSYRSAKLAVRHSIASQLALAKIESLQAVDPATLDATDNSSESGLQHNNISFARSVAITVNADESRTVTVNVQTEDSAADAVTFSHTFALWGNT